MNYILSLIIVSYKKPDLVKQCLESIYRYNDIGNQLEIIISDNSPDDSIYKIVRDNFSEVKYIHNGNIGFGAANNKGVAVANSAYILFLNPDTILVEPIFKFAIGKFESGVGMFGVQLIDTVFKKNTSYAFIDCFSIKKAIIGKICNKLGFFVPGKMAILGADIFIKKELFQGCGMFDENIFMYAEENDLSKRFQIKYPEHKIRFFKDKRIIHLEGGTTQIISSNPDEFVEGRMKTYKYYCNKWDIDLNKVIKFFAARYKTLAVISRLRGNMSTASFYTLISKNYKEEIKNETVL